MPEIYRGFSPEGAEHEGYITANGFVYKGGVGSEGGKYIGRVTAVGSIFRGGLIPGEDGEYVGVVRSGLVYKKKQLEEAGEYVGKSMQSWDSFVLVAGGVQGEGGSIIGWMKKPAGDIFDGINGMHAGAGLLLLLLD